jgi:hypothetical protein
LREEIALRLQNADVFALPGATAVAPNAPARPPADDA